MKTPEDRAAAGFKINDQVAHDLAQGDQAFEYHAAVHGGLVRRGVPNDFRADYLRAFVRAAVRDAVKDIFHEVGSLIFDDDDPLEPHAMEMVRRCIRARFPEHFEGQDA